MPSTGLFVVVEPPAGNTPRGATLLRSANVIPNTPDQHWMGGIRWRPLICGQADINRAILACHGAISAPFTTLSTPAFEDYVPPSVAVAVPCSAISGEAELQATKERAVALLDRCATIGIARELWTGSAAVAENPDLPNGYLANNATVFEPNGVTSTPAIEALAWLEETLGQRSCAGGSMIHCSPFTATIWQSAHLLERQPDGRLLTALGTIVVADPGYDGSSPSGTLDATKATAWAYGTGMVDVRLGPIETLPPGQELASGVNRSNNDFNVYAYRPFAATFDPCAHVGIKVNHASRV